MSKRSIVILIVAISAGLVIAVTVPPLLDSPSRIAGRAAGTWQEIGQTPANTMQVSRSSSSRYAVTYPRWSYRDEEFSLMGYKLLGGGGENLMNNSVKTITYDNDSDELTISDASGEHSFTFQRVARPSGITGVMREYGGPYPGVRRMPDVLIEVRWRSVDGPVVAGTTSDKGGRFRMTVAPGRYWVVPVAKGDETVTPDQVTVEKGDYATAKVSLDRLL